jgi:hypothetical protein
MLQSIATEMLKIKERRITKENTSSGLIADSVRKYYHQNRIQSGNERNHEVEEWYHSNQPILQVQTSVL